MAISVSRSIELVGTKTSNAGDKQFTTTASAGAVLSAASAVVLALSTMMFASPAKAAPDCDSLPGPGLDWRECSKSNIMLQGNNFEGADLFGADLSATDLSNTDLTGANLGKATLVRAWFKGAKADKANFARVEAYRTSFSKVSANGASFSNAELQRADFSGAQLNGTDFEKAELGRANFQDATLTGANFSLANLSRANLGGAKFEGPLSFTHAFMYLTKIEDMDLSAAVGLEQAQIELACGNAATKLPAGLSTPTDWPCVPD